MTGAPPGAAPPRPLRRPPPRFVLRILGWWGFGAGGYAIARLTGSRYRMFLSLRGAAERALRRGKLDKASGLALELLDLSEGFRQNWNFGNAIHHGHRLLGEVALRRGDVASARAALLASGRTPGSPQLNSFGPNMTLAKGLLEAGERDAVLQYFDLCAAFWASDFRGSLTAWAMGVRAGRTPEFGANLLY